MRVYAIITLKTYQGNIGSIGMRQLATLIGVSRMSIAREIKDLIEAGHIKAAAGKSGKRAVYELTSPVFGQKQGKRTEIVRGASGGPRFASIAVEDVA